MSRLLNIRGLSSLSICKKEFILWAFSRVLYVGEFGWVLGREALRRVIDARLESLEVRTQHYVQIPKHRVNMSRQDDN